MPVSLGLPASIIARMAALHRQHGVMLHLNARLDRIESSAQQLTLHLGDECLAVDLVLVGIGASPETALAKAAGLAVAEGIITDRCGRTSHPDMYAAGEVARFPHPMNADISTRQESWQVAQDQPMAVAHAIMGQDRPYDVIPWHWTDQYNCNLQVLGEPTDTLHQIERTEGERMTLLCGDSGGRLRGAVLINNGRDATPCRRLIASGKVFDMTEFADIARPLRSFL
jgi:NADPH-dependent 2,4-dienoyl-CoA reductase/sulfur reductase-like enzyme